MSEGIVYKPTFSEKAWGNRAHRLEHGAYSATKEKLENFNDLPYGAIKEALRFLDPQFGKDFGEGKPFQVRVCEERTITQSRTITFTIRADDLEQAKTLAKDTLYSSSSDDLEELEDSEVEDDWEDDDVDYGRSYVVDVTELGE